MMSVCVAMSAVPSAQAQVAAPQPERMRALVHLVRQDCGSCHGLTLQGGLGPALTAAALRDKPREGLIATIVGGRPGTPMPPFRGIVSEDEAVWVVDRLIEGFPADGGPAAIAPPPLQPRMQ
ncbi:c-type cytochrome [Aromatoleum diolicum]